jgi:hypothetical protein
MVVPDVVSEDDIAKLVVFNDLSDEPTLKAYVEVKVYDSMGHIIQHYRQPMRSPTEYFLALVSIPLVGTYQSSSSATAQSILTSVLGLPSQISTTYTANIAWNWSIQLGSGTQSYSPTLTSLAAPISNGTGAGQLSYGSVSVGYSSSTISTYVAVTNNSGSAITVTEIGLIGTVYIYTTNSSGQFTYSSYSFLLTYDTLLSPITLNPGYIATFEVILQFSG